MAFFPIEKLINLADGYRRVFRIDHYELLLLEHEGERWLMDRRCPHAGQVLDDAQVSERTIRCPHHGLCFSLEDGSSSAGACDDLRVYPLIYEGNTLGIDDALL